MSRQDMARNVIRGNVHKRPEAECARLALGQGLPSTIASVFDDW